MTIEGRSFDGWPLSKDSQFNPPPLVRTKRQELIAQCSFDLEPLTHGRPLAIAIRQSLKDRGIEISDERYELIAEACEKEIEKS